MRLGLTGFIDPTLMVHVEECRQVNARRGTRRGPGNLDEVQQVRAAQAQSTGSTAVESTLTTGGFSAGATLTVTTLLRLRDSGAAHRVSGAALQFGTYDLSGLPSLLMVVGELDVLLEDSFAMAARVCTAGGEVDLRVYPESPHGFTNRDTAMAKAARHDVETWLAGRVT